MRARRQVPAEARRTLWVLIALAYVALIPIGLQLYFHYEHETAAEIAMGVVTTVYFVALIVWLRRSGVPLFQLRRARKPRKPT